MLSPGETLFWIAGPLAGVGMGGVWVVGRTIVVELYPPEKIGEFFGIYGLAGKFASILCPLLLGTVVWILQDTEIFKYRAAVGTLLVITVITIFLFNRLQKQIPYHKTIG